MVCGLSKNGWFWPRKWILDFKRFHHTKNPLNILGYFKSLTIYRRMILALQYLTELWTFCKSFAILLVSAKISSRFLLRSIFQKEYDFNRILVKLWFLMGDCLLPGVYLNLDREKIKTLGSFRSYWDRFCWNSMFCYTKWWFLMRDGVYLNLDRENCKLVIDDLLACQKSISS